MPLNFPNSPSVNDLFTFNDRTWIYNGDGWAINTIPGPGVGAAFADYGLIVNAPSSNLNYGFI